MQVNSEAAWNGNNDKYRRENLEVFVNMYKCHFPSFLSYNLSREEFWRYSNKIITVKIIIKISLWGFFKMAYLPKQNCNFL